MSAQFQEHNAQSLRIRSVFVPKRNSNTPSRQSSTCKVLYMTGSGCEQDMLTSMPKNQRGWEKHQHYRRLVRFAKLLSGRTSPQTSPFFSSALGKSPKNMSKRGAPAPFAPCHKLTFFTCTTLSVKLIRLISTPFRSLQKERLQAILQNMRQDCYYSDTS